MTTDTRGGRKPLKDTDSAASAHRFRILVWSAIAIVPAVLAGELLSMRGMPKIWIPFIALGAWVAAYLGITLLTSGAGNLAASVYMAGGSSTPMLRQYSLADAMIARGRFDDAATELRGAITEQPDDPEPRLRLARLLRDHLKQYDDAAACLRAAASCKGATPAIETAAVRELAELYTHRLRTPSRALPDLARLAARHPATPAGDWARRQIQEIKQEMKEQHDV